jgi:predicted lipoprotein with Yx(FWY)xxD motif
MDTDPRYSAINVTRPRIGSQMVALKRPGKEHMSRMSRRIAILLAGALALMLAGCGVTGNGYGSSSSNPPGSSSSSDLPIKTSTVTVKGASTTVLTDSRGYTLYYRTDDTPTTPACTGGCLAAWPPLLVPGGQSPTSAATLAGALSVLSDSSRRQVEYNGHELYTFASDTGPGQANGEGVGGIWFVATPTLAAGSASPTATPSASAGSPTATPCQGIYCYNYP